MKEGRSKGFRVVWFLRGYIDSIFEKSRNSWLDQLYSTHLHSSQTPFPKRRSPKWQESWGSPSPATQQFSLVCWVSQPHSVHTQKKEPKKKHSTKVEIKILILPPSITQSTYMNWSRILLMILATLLRLGRLYITQNAQNNEQKVCKNNVQYLIIIIVVTLFPNLKLLCYKTNMSMDGYVAKIMLIVPSNAMEVV